MRINFDMDGTIANLYGVENWLEMLIAHDETPYANAKPLINLSLLARYLNKIQRKGVEIGVISWLSKNSNDDYDERVTNAKLRWLKKHLPSVNWDNIVVVPYGTPKENYALTENDILFDDEEQNRNNWKGFAYTETEIFTVLKSIAVQTSFLPKVEVKYLPLFGNAAWARAKIFSVFLEKTLDKPTQLWYYNYRKKKGEKNYGNFYYFSTY